MYDDVCSDVLVFSLYLDEDDASEVIVFLKHRETSLKLNLPRVVLL